MKIQAIKIRRLYPPQDNLEGILEKKVVKLLRERMIVAIASKVVAISEGRTISVSQILSKDKLIQQESEFYLPRKYTPGGWVMHTIKHHTLIPTAGIDESNAANHYILWPDNPQQSAQRILKFLKTKSGVKQLGVVITDSHSVPMRRGVTGISIGYAGFQPLYDYRGQLDLFQRPLKISQANIPDSLAAAAVLVMGEGAEQTPICLISQLPKTIQFGEDQLSSKQYSSFYVPMEEDLYQPFLKRVPWRKGGKKV